MFLVRLCKPLFELCPIRFENSIQLQTFVYKKCRTDRWATSRDYYCACGIPARRTVKRSRVQSFETFPFEIGEDYFSEVQIIHCQRSL